MLLVRPPLPGLAAKPRQQEKAKEFFMPNFWKKFKETFNKRFDGESVRCAYCGAYLIDSYDVNGADPRFNFSKSDMNASADHVVPQSKGGSNSPSNIMPCCRKCNSQKRDRTFPTEWAPTKYDPSVMEEYYEQMSHVAALSSGLITLDQVKDKSVKKLYGREK